MRCQPGRGVAFDPGEAGRGASAGGSEGREPVRPQPDASLEVLGLGGAERVEHRLLTAVHRREAVQTAVGGPSSAAIP